MAEITGRKVLIITTTFFGVIIAVNLTMAFKAVSTFPGVEVKNSYVASQTFDADRKAQNALGWDLAHDYDPVENVLKLSFTDAATGYPSEVSDLRVLVGRATQARQDEWPEFQRISGSFVAPLDLEPGKWMLRVEATSPDGTLFRQRIDLFVRGQGS